LLDLLPLEERDLRAGEWRSPNCGGTTPDCPMLCKACGASKKVDIN
jgi:hypothetical protein